MMCLTQHIRYKWILVCVVWEGRKEIHLLDHRSNPVRCEWQPTAHECFQPVFLGCAPSVGATQSTQTQMQKSIFLRFITSFLTETQFWEMCRTMSTCHWEGEMESVGESTWAVSTGQGVNEVCVSDCVGPRRFLTPLKSCLYSLMGSIRILSLGRRAS